MVVFLQSFILIIGEVKGVMTRVDPNESEYSEKRIGGINGEGVKRRQFAERNLAALAEVKARHGL